MGRRKRIKLKLSMMMDMRTSHRIRPRMENDIIVDLLMKRREINQFNRLHNVDITTIKSD